jgi:hypothetical protein
MQRSAPFSRRKIACVKFFQNFFCGASSHATREVVCVMHASSCARKNRAVRDECQKTLDFQAFFAIAQRAICDARFESRCIALPARGAVRVLSERANCVLRG